MRSGPIVICGTIVVAGLLGFELFADALPVALEVLLLDQRRIDDDPGRAGVEQKVVRAAAHDHAHDREPVDEAHGKPHRRLALRKLDDAPRRRHLDVARVGRSVERAVHQDLLALVAERVDGPHARRFRDALADAVVVVARGVAAPPLDVLAAHDVAGALVDVQPLVASVGRVHLDDVGVERGRVADHVHVALVARVAEGVLADRVALLVHAGVGEHDPVAVLLPAGAAQDAALVHQRPERRRLANVAAEPVHAVRADGAVLEQAPVFEHGRRARVLAAVRSFVERSHARQRCARRNEPARLVLDRREPGHRRNSHHQSSQDGRHGRLARSANAKGSAEGRIHYNDPTGPIASSRFFKSLRKPLATAPSTTRWSSDMQTFIIERTAIASSSRTTGRFTTASVVTIAV
jgi:hypothetical protein